MKEFTKLQREVHNNAIAHGFWDGNRRAPELLCLIHSEVSEALEAYRNRDIKGMGAELADIVIRVMDMAEHYGYNLIEEVKNKHEINKARPYKHDKLC